MLATVKTHGQMFPSEQCVPWLLACEQQKYELFKNNTHFMVGFLQPQISLLVSPPKAVSWQNIRVQQLFEQKISHPVAGLVLYILNQFFFLNYPNSYHKFASSMQKRILHILWVWGITAFLVSLFLNARLLVWKAE